MSSIIQLSKLATVLQSTVGKKMAVVHFTTIPCEPNTANKHIERHIFGEIHPCTNNIEYARFEVFRTFLCIFMGVSKVSNPKNFG